MKKTKVNATEEEVQNITDFFIFRKIGSRKSNIEQGLSDEQFNSSYNFVKDTIASIEKFLIQKDDVLKIIFCVIFIEEVIMFKSEDEDEIVECIEDAKKYKTYTEWKEISKRIYGYSKHKKWLQEIKSLVFNQ